MRKVAIAPRALPGSAGAPAAGVRRGWQLAVNVAHSGRAAAQRPRTRLRRYPRPPLGITDVEWVAGTDGLPAAASGLRMRPRDLARIGRLILDEGAWQGRQIVPRDWLDASFGDPVAARHGLEYGYQWWLGRGRADARRWIAGFGNGGQRLIVIPDLELVVVVMAGNDNQPDAWKISVALMRDIVLPATERAESRAPDP